MDAGPIDIDLLPPEPQRAAALPVYPSLLPGESFASWMTRTAARYHLSARHFLADVLGWQPSKARWHAAGLLTEQHHRLAAAMVVSVETLRDFTPTTGLAYHASVCPACLAEDKEPYRRALWSTLDCTVCARHGLLLIDHCGRCRSPVDVPWQIRAAGDCPATLAHCGRCGNLLAARSGIPAEPSPIRLNNPIVVGLLQAVLTSPEGLAAACGQVWTPVPAKPRRAIPEWCVADRYSLQCITEWLTADAARLDWCLAQSQRPTTPHAASLCIL